MAIMSEDMGKFRFSFEPHPESKTAAMALPNKNEELDNMALDRLKSAQTPFELDKAQAIAAYVQWRIERAGK